MKSVLCIFAHPDDEIFAGGTLAHLSTNGIDVHLLCMTRGENGAPGYPPIADRSKLGAIRMQEMQCAAEMLGVASLQFLDYTDIVGEAGEMIEFEHDPVCFQSEITDAIYRTQADLVLTHGSDGEYGHPAHKLVHRMVASAVQAVNTPPLLYSFQADFDTHPDKDNANQSDNAHIILNIEQYTQSHVINLFECHHTQSSWWVHLKSEKLGRPATRAESWHLYPQEGLHRHFPFVDKQPYSDALTVWLQAHPTE